jgi:hypothetical protein
MKRLLIITIFFHFSFFSFGQKYLTSDLILKAEILIKNYIPDSIFNKYCIYDTTSEYYYWDKGICIGENLSKNDKTKGKFNSAIINWKVCILYPSCPILNQIKGNVFIILDKNLELSKAPDLNFIPETYWSLKTCDFISKEYAITLAKQENLKNGIDSLQASIGYNSKEKQYFWYISQTLEKKQEFHSGRTEPYEIRTIETLIINAISGKIVYHEITDISPVI